MAGISQSVLKVLGIADELMLIEKRRKRWS